jgi:spore coat polysaccharide biosynthesis protein SpsF
VRTVAIIQARLGSERLPGKVLLDLEGKSVLERVVSRARAIERADAVVVATSQVAADDRIAAECRRLRVECVRGSEDDVLDRFVAAAEHARAEACVRITADCPLLDPGVSDSIIRRFDEANGAADYVSNKIPQSFPRGLDTEVFTRDALERAWRDAKLPHERAHVTPYLYHHPELFRLISVTSDVDRADWRWTIDTPEDLEFVRELYRRIGDREDFTWLDVVDIVESDSELMLLNRHVRQKDVELG